MIQNEEAFSGDYPCLLRELFNYIETVDVDEFSNTDDMIKMVEKYLLNNRILKKNDKYVIIAGVPVGLSGTTNLIRVETIN